MIFLQIKSFVKNNWTPLQYCYPKLSTDSFHMVSSVYLIEIEWEISNHSLLLFVCFFFFIDFSPEEGCCKMDQLKHRSNDINSTKEFICPKESKKKEK